MNLIETWRESIKNDGLTLTEAVRRMNAITRLKTLTGHIDEMKKGKRDINAKIINYIMNDTWYFLSVELKLTIEEIKDCWTLPERVK